LPLRLPACGAGRGWPAFASTITLVFRSPLTLRRRSRCAPAASAQADPTWRSRRTLRTTRGPKDRPTNTHFCKRRKNAASASASSGLAALPSLRSAFPAREPRESSVRARRARLARVQGIGSASATLAAPRLKPAVLQESRSSAATGPSLHPVLPAVRLLPLVVGPTACPLRRSGPESLRSRRHRFRSSAVAKPAKKQKQKQRQRHAPDGAVKCSHPKVGLPVSSHCRYGRKGRYARLRRCPVENDEAVSHRANLDSLRLWETHGATPRRRKR
jgi:hypothetical protein